MKCSWPEDLRRAFVAGAKWWEYHSRGATMWQSDQRLAEDEAEIRYGSTITKQGEVMSLKDGTGIKLTDKPNVAGQRKIHRLIGGGPGLGGRYVKGETWCGVERRSKVILETDDPVTCKTCLRAMKWDRIFPTQPGSTT